VYVGSKLSYVFIFNEVTWFFPSSIYLRVLGPLLLMMVTWKKQKQQKNGKTKKMKKDEQRTDQERTREKQHKPLS
jgi:hypothetical protein